MGLWSLGAVQIAKESREEPGSARGLAQCSGPDMSWFLLNVHFVKQLPVC